MSNPASQAVLDGVRDLLPTLRERADDAERLRVVPEASIKELEETGFFRLLQPPRFDGLEADPVTFYTAVRDIASACGSTGWVASVVGVHPWQVALFADEAQQAVWGEDTNTRLSSSYAPTGKATVTEGGYLLNGAKQRFMPSYDPLAERATRDFVSRAMYTEIRKGNVTPNGGLYISMAHLGPEKVAKNFKGMVERCADCGFDLAGGLVEVVPTAHYMMGGVEFNLDCTTELPGLFVAGEDAGRPFVVAGAQTGVPRPRIGGAVVDQV